MTLVTVNGEPREVAAATVEALLAELGIEVARRGVAVALDGRVVRRAAWATTPIGAGARLEVVRPLQGG